VRDLDEQIIANEMGAFLGWALSGAADVARNGGIIETQPHRAKLDEWRVGNNSALAFVLDRQACERDCTLPAGHVPSSTPGQIVYGFYKQWAAANGFRPFGRNGFYDSLTAGAGGAGIRVCKRDNQIVIDGLRVRKEWAV
jgi:phage/plasmid-associated DNA primase